MTTRPDEQLSTPDPVSVLLGELRGHLLNEAEQHAIGYAEGFEAGYAAAHAEVAEWWGQLARKIRGAANNWTPYAERRRRELEWAKPRRGDYTGQLTPAEYFGADDAQQDASQQVTAMERRAAA